jgi:hypothetical protein
MVEPGPRTTTPQIADRPPLHPEVTPTMPQPAPGAGRDTEGARRRSCCGSDCQAAAVGAPRDQRNAHNVWALSCQG